MTLSGLAVTANRDIYASGGVGGNGGDVTVTASAGSATTLAIVSRGGLTVTANGNVARTGTLRIGPTEINAGGAISASVVTDALQVGGSSAVITGRISGQAGSAAVGQLQIVDTNIPNPCTVNGFARILPSPPPPEAAVAATSLTTDVNALTVAITQAVSPLPLRVADQETPAQEAFVQSPLIGAVPTDVFSSGYQLVRTTAIVPASGRTEQDRSGHAGEDEEQRDAIVPAAGPGNEEDASPSAGVDAYFTQDLWSGLGNR